MLGCGLEVEFGGAGPDELADLVLGHVLQEKLPLAGAEVVQPCPTAGEPGKRDGIHLHAAG